MNLTDDELKELNLLLKNSNLDLPLFRRSVSRTGGNYAWLQRNIWIRNHHLSDRLMNLLRIKLHFSSESKDPPEKPVPQKDVLASPNKRVYNTNNSDE